MDADRLAALHVPVTQLNTDPSFGGECHLDANMVRSALPELPLDEIDLLVIENVGNLVCPAEFRVGEDARIMVSSVTEGEEKPLKYPLMFRACELVLINKIDLLPHLDFDMDALPLQPRRGAPRGGAHPREREDGGGHRRVEATGSLAWRRPSRSPLDGAAREPIGSTRALADRTRANARLLRGRGGAARPPLPSHGRALRARRPADRVRALARRPLRRPPRGRGVRAPRDRRQARAAGARAGRRGRPARRAGRARSAEPDDIAIGFGAEETADGASRSPASVAA